MIEALERLLAKGSDSPELRFGLGNAYLEQGQPVPAASHLRACLALRGDYSAAWKLLGKAYQASADLAAAAEAWRAGIRVAERAGDKQAEKEMRLFLRRLERQLEP